MTENHRKILEMLSQGKISVADAERLLEKLKAPVETRADAAEEEAEAGGASSTGRINGAKPGAKLPKFLRVVVDGVAGEHVNVRVPVSLVRTGVRLGALLPKQARRAVEAQGVDLSGLSELDADELVRALAELEVNVEEVDGGRLRIFCE
ncbi:MAG: hypothetical protein HY017_24295 [Betaproteobacteria bacterium]|nr:hypothetical protein [Betaproteobacteria bacterium]